jgi:chromosome partitioning protein
MIITLLGFKGGVGKSTAAVHIAAYLQQYEPTLLVDGDPNRSISSWAHRGKLPCELCDQHSAVKLASKFKNIVIDTKARPESEDIEPLVKGCDLLILPTTPDALAIDALLLVLKVIPADANYKVLLNLIPPKPSKAGEEAIAFLEENSIPHYKTQIRRFTAYQRAALKGCPVYETCDRMGKIAWGDYQKLGREILNND